MKMNKYQEALDYLKSGNLFGELSNDALEDIKELVDKAAPMKPLHISLLTNPPKNIIVCGKCKLEVTEIHKYCGNCGQKIYWSDEE